LASANFINLERGANDSGLTGGDGSWSLNSLLGYVEAVHALGKNVIMDGGGSDEQGLAYNLPAYLLISNRGGALDRGRQSPGNSGGGGERHPGRRQRPGVGWEHPARPRLRGGDVAGHPAGSSNTADLPAGADDRPRRRERTDGDAARRIRRRVARQRRARA